jgi:ribose transport system permease protein
MWGCVVSIDAGAPTITQVRARRSGLVADVLLRYAMVWILILVAIVARQVYEGFFDATNLRILANQMTPITIIAVGSTFVIIAGCFDLSVGAIFATASVIYAIQVDHIGIWPAFGVTLAAGVAAGAVNGVLVTVLKINTFIATLGSSSLFVGLAYTMSNQGQVSPNALDFGNLGSTQWGGVWAVTYLLVAIIAIGAIVLHLTTFGLAVFAVGGNAEAARLAGKRVGLVIIGTYIISAVCAALAGMITASQSGVGAAGISGTVALDAITIVIVGGTSLLGGEGAIWRTVVGALIIAIISNVLGSRGVTNTEQLIVKGGVLILAVALDSFTRSRRVV